MARKDTDAFGFHPFNQTTQHVHTKAQSHTQVACSPFYSTYHTTHNTVTHTQVGKRADPFYKYLCLTLRNPNKIARITLNFEKVRLPYGVHVNLSARTIASIHLTIFSQFLLNAEGRPIRRYPRKYSGYDMEEDVKVREE